MQRHYDTWLSCPAVHEYTKGGNLKPPSRSLICDWVKSSWEDLPQEAIKKSFVSCAIATSLDGSDDHKIHCFKDGQPCAEGKSSLDEAMQALSASAVTGSDEDPFASDADEEEKEAIFGQSLKSLNLGYNLESHNACCVAGCLSSSQS